MIASAILAASCSERPCHSEIDAAGKYRVSLIEHYDVNSTFTFDKGVSFTDAQSTGPCTGDGFVPGLSVELDGAGTVDNRPKTCALVSANLAMVPSPITSVQPSSQFVELAQIGEPLIYSNDEATVGGCSGLLITKVFAGGGPGGEFGTPTPGELPPAIFYRLFVPETGSCQRCDDDFVAQLVKL